MRDPTLEEMLEVISALPCKSEMWEQSALESIYWFASENYCGAFSNLYKAMCRTGYEPSMGMNEENRFADNQEAEDFYLGLVAEYR